MSSGSGLPASTYAFPFVFTPRSVRPSGMFALHRCPVETSFTMSRISASVITWSWMYASAARPGCVLDRSQRSHRPPSFRHDGHQLAFRGLHGNARRWGHVLRGSGTGSDHWGRRRPRILEASSAAKQERHDEHDHGPDHQCPPPTALPASASNVMRSPSDNPQFFLKTSGFGGAFAYRFLTPPEVSCRSSSETQHIGI